MKSATLIVLQVKNYSMKKITHTFFLTSIIIFLAGVCRAADKNQYNAPLLNIKIFGAVGDGITLDSKAINKTIDSAVNAGGGTVYFPAGNYLCGSIHLKSNISLFLDQGATIIAAPIIEENGYDEEEASISVKYQDSGHSHWHNSLIWGVDLHDISILGPGMIYGKGLYKDWVKGSKQNANKAISLYRCRNVIMKDITIYHGGWFAILATGVDNLTIDNLKIDTNRDGMDIDCCRNVHISNCSVNSPYDDGICLKSTFALGFARATENVTISNCLVSGFDEGSFLDGTFTRHEKEGFGDPYPTGRIKFGTESNGGFKNITITNCTFDYCRGFALETVDGGLLEDVTITNITMRDICNSPIFLRLGARMRGQENMQVGELRRINISNIIAYNVDPAHGIIITGIPGHNIKDVELSNIKIYYKGGGTKEQASAVVPLLEKSYPEPGMFGVIPSYGLYIRYAQNMKLNNIEVSFMSEDKRPAIILDNVKGADFRFVKAQVSLGTPSLVIIDSEELNIFHSFNIIDNILKKIVRKEL